MATGKIIVNKDILDALTNVITNKGSYETAKVNGGDFGKYQTAAEPSYQYLADNGYGYLSDQLHNSNYITAQDLLNQYGLADSATDKAGDWTAANMGNIKSFFPDTGSTYNNYETGVKSNYNDFIDTADKGYKDTQGYLQPYAASLNDLYGKYSIGVDSVNNQNNQLWNDMRQFGTDQTARYDKLTDYIYTNDYTATPWYQTIMEGYNIGGEKAAGSAVADIGGSNSGNIDSYAAANARRQQLSFTNAGNTAALNAYNSQLGNLLGTIQSLGYDIGNLQNRQQANIDSSRTANQGMLDSYNQGNNILGNVQNDAVANLMNAYGLAGQNYNTGYNNLMGAKNTEAQTVANAYNDLLSRYADLDANQKTYDISELNAKYGLKSAETEGATTIRVQELLNEQAIKLQELVNAGALSEVQAEVEWRKYISDNDVKIAGSENEWRKYISNNDLEGVKSQSEATKSVATIQADADKYVADSKVGTSSATATNAEIQSNLIDLISGKTNNGKMGINAAQEILIALYPGSEDRVRAVVKDYIAANSGKTDSGTSGSGVSDNDLQWQD